MGRPDVPRGTPDPIQVAVDKVDAAPPVAMLEFTMTFGSTGRPFQIRVPADMIALEALDLASWVTNPATGLLARLATQRPSGIVVPGPGGIVRPS